MTAVNFAPTARARRGKGPRTRRQMVQRRRRAEELRRAELVAEQRVFRSGVAARASSPGGVGGRTGAAEPASTVHPSAVT